MATGMILNDEPSLSIVVTSAVKYEQNSGTRPFTFTVTRTGALSETTTVNYDVGFSEFTEPADVDDFSDPEELPGLLTFAGSVNSEKPTS